MSGEGRANRAAQPGRGDCPQDGHRGQSVGTKSASADPAVTVAKMTMTVPVLGLALWQGVQGVPLKGEKRRSSRSRGLLCWGQKD